MKKDITHAVVDIIKDLRTSRGYSSASTVEWRRVSMKWSDCALIQFARRLASRLETEKAFLVGVGEQDFNPKINVLNGSKFCILSLTKQIDDQTGERTYTLVGHIGQPLAGHLIDVSQPPTDKDLRYAVTIIKSASGEITPTKPGASAAPRSM